MVGVDMRESVGVTKSAVKAKSGALSFIPPSLAGGGALPARLCRNVGKAERQRTTHRDPKDRDRTMKPEETPVEVRSDSNQS